MGEHFCAIWCLKNILVTSIVLVFGQLIKTLFMKYDIKKAKTRGNSDSWVAETEEPQQQGKIH